MSRAPYAYWKRTGRKSRQWIDLVAVDPQGGERVLDAPELDQKIREISEANIANVLQRFDANGDPKVLLEELCAGKIEEPKPVKALYIAFHAHLENDPGMDEVAHEFIVATSSEKAEEAIYKKLGQGAEEFEYISIWPVTNLIDYLEETLKKKRFKRV